MEEQLPIFPKGGGLLMSEHLKLEIYESEAAARKLTKKPAIVANDSDGIQAAFRICAKWGVPADVVECIVITYNDDDTEDEMTEHQGNLREYAELFNIAGPDALLSQRRKAQ